jgi:hypothetical protein
MRHNWGELKIRISFVRNLIYITKKQFTEYYGEPKRTISWLYAE